jgi:hypothetical protein
MKIIIVYPTKIVVRGVKPMGDEVLLEPGYVFDSSMHTTDDQIVVRASAVTTSYLKNNK